MQMNKQSEKLGVLLTAVNTPQLADGILRKAAAEVAEGRAYRSLVFITPGGAFGNACMLFSSVVNAAYFLLRHTKTEWTKTCRKPWADEYQEMIRVRALIVRRCGDDEYNDSWWYARDSADEYITDMGSFSIADMRSYDYTQE